MGKNLKKNGCVYIYNESLCYTGESTTTLKINHNITFKTEEIKNNAEGTVYIWIFSYRYNIFQLTLLSTFFTLDYCLNSKGKFNKHINSVKILGNEFRLILLERRKE